ncbi:MAG: TRAP transporter large permease subunit [Synergistaceae bacterium]|jgi:tripartite ATP-independent transporter DctM subunit|nr:TRAP transporter large permease subunit [Synergistaceae bacterium]
MVLVAVLFVILLALNVPLAFTIGIASLGFFLITPDVSWITPIQKMVSNTQSFPLLAVPFFVLAGNLMNETGITARLIKFATVLTGHLAGGLALVSCVLSTLMGGVSGSACADAAMETRVLGPAMLERGYAKGYACAVNSITSLITATIPPGVGLILYGVTGEVSIGKLFLAGVVPGVVMCFMLMFTSWAIAKKRGYPVENDRPPTFREVWTSFFDSIWAILFPFILIVGIRFGIFTASEAGAFAAVYAFFIGKFIYRELTWKGMWETLKNTLGDNGVILYIIMTSSILGYGIIYDKVPQSMAVFITGLSQNKHVVILIICAFVFIAGMFMEGTVNTLLLTPIFLPIVKKLGVDPVHFGIVFMTTVTLGGMTPPVGTAMYSSCAILQCSVDEYTRESLPFFATILVEVLLLVYVPEIFMWLPNLVFG